VFQLARDRGKKICIRSAFLQGLVLMNPENLPTNMVFAKPVLDKLNRISKDLELSCHEIALGYLKVGMPNAQVVFGVDTSAQLKQNVKSWTKDYSQSLKNIVQQSFTNVSEKIVNPVSWS
jgi:aryl-alcohol dehydrogenase-like predicted oxidoreductase